MDEVYTCQCGTSLWSIHVGFIKCARCLKEYTIETVAFLDPSRFNDKVAIEKGLKKEE